MLNAVNRFLAPFSLTFTLGLVLSYSNPVMADDTDIYLDPSVPDPAEPMVMFILDWRSNLGSSVCTGVSSNASNQIESDCGYSTALATALSAQGAGTDGKITLFESLRAILKVVLDPLDGLKIGFMMSHRNDLQKPGGGDNCVPGTPEAFCANGAFIPFGFRSITSDENDQTKEFFEEMLSNIPDPQGNDAHAYQGKEVYFELFRYLTGQGVLNGHHGYTDFTGDDQENLDLVDLPDDPNGSDDDITNYGTGGNPGLPETGPRWDSDTIIGWDTTIEDGSNNYISPLDGVDDCAKIYAINIIFSVTTGDDDSDSYIEDTEPDGGFGGKGELDFFELSGGSDQQFEQVIGFMNDVDLADGTDSDTPNYAKDTSGNPIAVDGNQNVTSYFLVPSPSTKENGYAAAGGTGNAIDSDVDPDGLIKILSDVFESILSVSTTFVAPSVPVNVFNRSQVVDEVFLALFEADENALPAWPGNVKKLSIGQNAITNNFELQDANGNQAIEIDGRIKDSALTLWTTVDGSSTDPNANLAGATDDAADSVDGRDVTRGGVGQQMPGFLYSAVETDNSVGMRNSEFGARQLFTEVGSDATLDGDNDNLIPLDVEEDEITDLIIDPSDNTQTTRSYSVTTASNPVLCDIWDEITAEWDPKPLQSDDATEATDCNDARDEDLARARDILLYARGREYVDLDTDGVATTGGGVITDLNVDIQPVNRKWILGDPLHSRPSAINYGERAGYDDGDPTTVSNPDIRLFFGSNDGFYHLVTNTNTDGSQSGAEAWAFAPREIISKWERLYNNIGDIDPIHPLTSDGSAVVNFHDENADGTIDTTNSDPDDSVDIIFGLGRGGKCYYSMDATDPDSPQLNWKICRGDVSVDNIGNFDEMAQTWSRPNIGKIEYDDDNDASTDPVIVDIAIFGGGYNGDDEGDNVDDEDLTDSTVDIGKDLANRDTNGVTTTSSASGDIVNDPVTRAPMDPSAIGTDDEGEGDGNAIYIINLQTGALIWKVTRVTGSDSYTSSDKTLDIDEMVDSFPAEVGAFDTDGDDFIDRIYAGDTGGRVWRIDLASDDPATWTANILFNGGRHYGNGGTDGCDANSQVKACDRRFFNRPDLVQTISSGTNFDAVLIGSGDREDPNETTVDNFFYMIKDYGTNIGQGGAYATITHDVLADVTSDSCSQDITNAGCNGGAPDLTRGWKLGLEAGDGEKGLSRSLTLGGIVVFSTFSPGLTGSACDLNEGTGRQYVINLLDATAVYNFNTANDAGGTTYERFDVLESGGIPVEAVPLGDDLVLMQGQAPGGNEGEQASNLQALGVNTFWKTYWYERDSDD